MFLEAEEFGDILNEENRYIALLKSEWEILSLPGQTEHALRIGKRTELLGNLQFKKEQAAKAAKS